MRIQQKAFNFIVERGRELAKSLRCTKPQNVACNTRPTKILLNTSENIKSQIGDSFIKGMNPVKYKVSEAITTIPSKFGNFSQETHNKFNEFLKIVQKRNHDKTIEQKHIEMFAKSFFKNPNYTTEDEIIRYFNRFIEMANKKTPQGEYLMTSSECRWFADIRGNGLGKRKVTEFRALMECAERGLVPKSALRNLNIAEGVHPNILSDLEKLKFAEKNGLNPIDVFIPEFESMRYNHDEILKLKSGDLFSIKSGAYPGLYIKNNDSSYLSISKLNIDDRETLFKLLPPIKRFYIEQNGSGTCYQLGAYIAYLSNPSFMKVLLKSIRPAENGGLMIAMPSASTSKNMFAGLFADFSKHGNINIKLEGHNLILPDESQSVISNPLIKALEHLYGKYRKYTIAEQWVKQLEQQGYNSTQQAKAFEFAKHNMDKVVYIKDSTGKYKIKSLADINAELLAQNNTKQFKSVEDYYKNEGGKIDEIFKFFNTYLSSADNRNIGYLWNRGGCSTENLNKVREALQIPRAIKMFGTIPKGKHAEDILNQNKNIISEHGYCILDYNPITDIVKYINPHDSALVYDLRLEDLMKYVNTFSLCRI